MNTNNDEAAAFHQAIGGAAAAEADNSARAEYEVKYMAGAADGQVALLDQFITSAEEIGIRCQRVITDVEEGRLDPLKVAVAMKAMEKMQERFKEVLAPYYLSEAGKYGDKPFKYRGTEISVGEVGVKYNYSVCKHPAWDRLTALIENAETQRKEVEEFLKVLKSPTDLILEGEGVTVYPPKKSGKTSIKISIK